MRFTRSLRFSIEHGQPTTTLTMWTHNAGNKNELACMVAPACKVAPRKSSTDPNEDFINGKIGSPKVFGPSFFE